MIRVFLLFIFLAVFFSFSISTIRALSGKEKLELIKLIGLAIIYSTLSILTLFAIVILF